MRTKIRVDDKWYRPVPWLVEEDGCSGCAFEMGGCINNGFNGKFSGLCDANQEFDGMIFIPNTKEALADYIAKKLEGA